MDRQDFISMRCTNGDMRNNEDQHHKINAETEAEYIDITRLFAFSVFFAQICAKSLGELVAYFVTIFQQRKPERVDPGTQCD